MDQLPSGIIISDESSIDFKEMLNDYRHLFAGRKVVITTNYNLLSELVIYFDVNNLPHLMGWSKVRNKNKSATRIIKDIDCGKFTKKSAKKSPLWEDIRKRNLNYNLLHRIFFDRDIKVLVETSQMKPNRLRLDIVFVYNKANESVVLGFRKDRIMDYFVPTTLHTEKLDNQYNHRRRTRITNMKWINY